MIEQHQLAQKHQLALARRLRPRTFQTVVGQEVTLRALSNALETGRLHHAYLFTGTRGIGKTTLARIFAKCLNCEQGVTATPCGQCATCLAIDEGRCVDVLEVDAASRTKVEDTRELLENIQYLPNRARFKIYLIDEVHMLSVSSFNALLKSLEEPPSHVKFLFATTDPQKIPLTVLSRCLQFHLHPLTFAAIVQYLQKVLTEESISVKEEKSISFEVAALEDIARASEGSLRDALSLLEQAMAYGEGKVITSDVQKMLGLTEKTRLLSLLQALIDSDAAKMLSEIESLSQSTPNFASVLTEFLTLLRHVAIAQKMPDALDESIAERGKILELAQQLEEEEVQLYFQIGILGQKDLPYAPTSRIGFEMIMLRMMSLQPYKVSLPTKVENIEDRPNPTNAKLTNSEPTNANPANAHGTLDWSALLSELPLGGIVKQLAEHCTVTNYIESENALMLNLMLEESQKPLLQKRHEDKLKQLLSEHFKRDIKLKIHVGKTPLDIRTPANQYQRNKAEQSQAARSLMESDPNLQALVSTFDAKIEEIVIDKM